MSTITAEPRAARASSSANARTSALSFGGVVRSEWIKLRSLRSTVWSYLLLVAIWVGMAFLMSMSMTSGMGDDLAIGTAAPDAQRDFILMSSTFGAAFGQLIVAVLGVLVISGEYSTGMIRSTLTAVPRRLPALAAKALVLFSATFVVSLVSVLISFLVSSVIYGVQGASASIVDPNVVLALLGASFYLGLVSLFALALGTVLRSSAGGIAAVLGILLVLPTVLTMIPVGWAQDLTPYLLSSAGMNLFGQSAIVENFAEFAKNAGIAVAWVVAAIAGASILLKKRDA